MKEDIIEDLQVGPVQRQIVAQRLGLYGTWVAVTFLRNFPEAQLNDLRNHLLLKSGFPDLRERIFAHFGNRAYLLKILNDLGNLRSISFSLRNVIERPDLSILMQVEDQIEKYISSNFAYTELNVLTEYYRLTDAEKISTLHLTESQIEEFLHAMGERGSSVSYKLGIYEPSEYIDLIEITKEKIRKWKALSNGATSISNITKQIAEATVRSYEFILQQLSKPS
jgi:ribosomal protein S16